MADPRIGAVSRLGQTLQTGLGRIGARREAESKEARDALLLKSTLTTNKLQQQKLSANIAALKVKADEAKLEAEDRNTPYNWAPLIKDTVQRNIDPLPPEPGRVNIDRNEAIKQHIGLLNQIRVLKSGDAQFKPGGEGEVFLTDKSGSEFTKGNLKDNAGAFQELTKHFLDDPIPKPENETLDQELTRLIAERQKIENVIGVFEQGKLPENVKLFEQDLKELNDDIDRVQKGLTQIAVAEAKRKSLEQITAESKARAKGAEKSLERIQEESRARAVGGQKSVDRITAEAEARALGTEKSIEQIKEQAKARAEGAEAGKAPYTKPQKIDDARQFYALKMRNLLDPLTGLAREGMEGQFESLIHDLDMDLKQR